MARESWRNHPDHKSETKAVKAALTAAGIPATVSHDHGTAWAWLVINLGPAARYSEGLREKASRIALEVTGRDASYYSGQIMVLAQ